MEISVAKQEELREIRKHGNKLAETEWMADLGYEIMRILESHGPRIQHRIIRQMGRDPKVKETFFGLQADYDPLKQRPS